MEAGTLTLGALGTQPVRDGLLVCHYCGKGFRFLAPHLTAVHGVTSGEYKAEFELPARGLIAESTRAKKVAHARHLLATDPRVRDGILTQDPAVNRQSLRNARKAYKAAAKRAGVKAIWQETGRRAAAANAQARRDAHDGRARELGYRDLPGLLTANRHLSNPELGALLGCSASRASSLRRAHNAPSQYQKHKARQGKQAQQQASQHTFAQALAAFGTGIQPLDPRGRWQCTACGTYPSRLETHLMQEHQLPTGKYLNRLQQRVSLEQAALDAGYASLTDLFAAIPVNGTEKTASLLGYTRRNLHNVTAMYADLPALPTFEAMAVYRSQAASRAQARKRDEARRRYDHLAQAAGHENITTLLQATARDTYKQVADLLGVPPHRVQHLRARYLPGPRSK